MVSERTEQRLYRTRIADLAQRLGGTPALSHAFVLEEGKEGDHGTWIADFAQ
jgi:hypothetical protein